MLFRSVSSSSFPPSFRRAPLPLASSRHGARAPAAGHGAPVASAPPSVAAEHISVLRELPGTRSHPQFFPLASLASTPSCRARAAAPSLLLSSPATPSPSNPREWMRPNASYLLVVSARPTVAVCRFRRDAAVGCGRRRQLSGRMTWPSLALTSLSS